MVGRARSKKKFRRCHLGVFFAASKRIWSKYSMLRSVLNVRENIDIKFPKLEAFLKRQSTGYVSKKSLTLERDEISRFLVEAPDRDYLNLKVSFLNSKICIF